MCLLRGAKCSRGILYKCRSHTTLRVRRFGQPAAQTHPHLLQEGEVTPGLTQHDFRSRRQSLMARVAATTAAQRFRRHIVIVPSATKQYMSYDIPYHFRQNSDFLYLCGFQEPDSLLVLQNEDDATALPNHKAVLFVRKNDAAMERFEGAVSGVEGTLKLTGVEEAYSTEQLPQYLKKYLDAGDPFLAWYDHRTPYHVMFHNKYLADFIVANKGGFTEDPKPLLHTQRLVKSRAEMSLMKETCEIGANAFKEVMKFSRPGIPEAHLFAKFDFECRINGAQLLAFPPVVAGGERAMAIHYIRNDNLVEDGDLVLMDAGCERHGYTSDITRTWPISGVFTHAQRVLYEALLEVQVTCVALCVAGSTLEDNHRQMKHLLAKQFHRVGLLKQSENQIELISLARVFCPHHLGHYLGMDVHDTDSISRTVPLQPGTVVTIEPGLYIPSDMEDVHKEFRGLAMRIEDDVLITDSGPDVLTSACPKHPDEIEQLLATR